jgi:hypothetical protein
MTTFDELLEIANRKACDFRNVCTILFRPDFKSLYANSSVEDMNRVDRLVQTGAYDLLRTWYRSKLNSQLGDKSVRELRQIAAALSIPDYARLKKPLLLSEIVKRQHGPEKSD